LQAEIVEITKDDDENILALRAVLSGTEVILISIYGPNNTDRNFFENLDNIISRAGSVPVILAGDWNCTFSTENISDNIDCFNMRRLPNLTHSRLLEDLCNKHDLTDPYRIIYPERIDFSYSPRAAVNVNRSRLDFFIVSDTLIDIIDDCYIRPGLQNKLFDHKAVDLILNQKKIPQKGFNMSISNKELDDDLLDFLVHAVTSETYLIHSRAENFNGRNKREYIETCGLIRILIRESGPPLNLIVGNEISEEDIGIRQRRIDRLSVLKLRLP
jgi:hypothetical protein